MKVLILAAGYGTRLERDILDDKSGKFAHLVGVPKPLVPVGSVPLLTHWLLVLEKCPTINISRDVFIVCNSFNQPKFQAYLASLQPSTSPSSPSSSSSQLPSLYIPLSHLICDNTTSNENRLGAIRDIDLFVTREGLLATNEDILVLGGDTLFDPQNFSLSYLLDKFNSLPKDGSLVLHHYVEDRFVNKTGILELAQDNRVVKFIEKPQPTETASRKACPCLYIYRSNLVKLLHEYVQQAKTLKEVDAPGTYIAYSHSRAPVYAEGVGRRFDIGGLETYIEANQFYLNLEKDNKLSLNEVYRKFETMKRKSLIDESNYVPKPISDGKNEADSAASSSSSSVAITMPASSSAPPREPWFYSTSWLLQFIPADVWSFIVNHHCKGVCPHTSCFLAAFRGFRQGIVYGAKVRFPHALVMTVLFGSGTVADKVNSILNATYAHSRNLGLYVMLYKSLQCLVRHIRQKESGTNALISGFLAGGFMFGENTPVNVQINMYVFSRVCFGLARTAVRHGYFSEDAHKWAYPLFAALSWALVMYLFEFEKDTLQKSLISSMIYLYSDSNQWPADTDGLFDWFVKA